MDFKLVSDFKPTGDQPQAIEKLTMGLNKGLKHQTLLGVTGSGKTFTIANVIQQIQKPTLVISHNKTLAAQLYQEFRDFFPENAVSYFVSYYDYYQPEAYIPQTNTYIAKDTKINEEIDKLRLAATTNILTRKDTIVVASVSCIYNLGSPVEYGRFILELRRGVKISRESIYKRLIDLQYDRNDYNFKRSTFRVRGENIEILPSYDDFSIKLQITDNQLIKIQKIDPLTGSLIADLEAIVIYPAKHYATDPKTYSQIFKEIREDLEKQIFYFKKAGKEIEAQRISERVNYDLEMIKEIGYVSGIENYSRYFDGRNPGDPPYSLIDYFNYPQNLSKIDLSNQAYAPDYKNINTKKIGKKADDNDQNLIKNGWLLIIDESHMTIPQIRGMYAGDRSRKQTLIDFGFRLPAAIDNRPLKYEEFSRKSGQVIYVSATPDNWEKVKAKEEIKKKRFLIHKGVVEQLIRPTGLTDPEIIIRKTKGQIKDLINQIVKRKERGERVLVTTLTKRMAEELSEYLSQLRIPLPINDTVSSTCGKLCQKLGDGKDKLIRVHYLHSEIKTLDRTDILDDLRLGKYDVLVGINLLREGLDLPEVSLVAILDADKEGFLRSETSLIQTMGRAARHVNSTVIMYADVVTGSMRRAIDEVTRRRNIQLEYNKKQGIVPKSIVKPVRKKLVEKPTIEQFNNETIKNINLEALTPQDKKELVKKLTKLMHEAARNLDFEQAARIRDKIKLLS